MWDVMESQGVDQETRVEKGIRGLGNQSSSKVAAAQHPTMWGYKDTQHTLLYSFNYKYVPTVTDCGRFLAVFITQT